MGFFRQICWGQNVVNLRIGRIFGLSLNTQQVRYFLFTVILFFVACGQKPSDQPDDSTNKQTIAISRVYSNSSYQNWLSKYNPELEYVNIYDLPDDQIDLVLKTASGYLLTGGCDVNPALHGHAGEEERCGKLDPRRDSLEILMIGRSFEFRKPLLGVCRGLQIMNVQGGGDLIIDLPSDRNTTIHRGSDGEVSHEVIVDSTKYLFEISDCLATMVVSHHHQAIGQLAEGYEVLAYSPDSIIEAFHFADTTVHPFALGVQYHPERMSQRNPLAGNVAREFLKHVSFASE